ncbi:hypothetical protein J4Q44_G00332450 [Coregonus suidteri]|uniref:Uncharacterized protein n=1 Tax=Coregonus suidteri TaxID=861788 RepID=A0AAN8KSX2_9TELE
MTQDSFPLANSKLQSLCTGQGKGSWSYGSQGSLSHVGLRWEWRRQDDHDCHSQYNRLLTVVDVRGRAHDVWLQFYSCELELVTLIRYRPACHPLSAANSNFSGPPAPVCSPATGVWGVIEGDCLSINPMHTGRQLSSTGSSQMNHLRSSNTGSLNERLSGRVPGISSQGCAAIQTKKKTETGQNWLANAVFLLGDLKAMQGPNITTFLHYDIACQLKPHLQKNSPDLMVDTTFAVPAFHAYAHDADCQITDGTRYVTGSGLAEGEQMERVREKQGINVELEITPAIQLCRQKVLKEQAKEELMVLLNSIPELLFMECPMIECSLAHRWEGEQKGSTQSDVEVWTRQIKETLTDEDVVPYLAGEIRRNSQSNVESRLT